MNKIDNFKQKAVLSSFCEGNSIRSTERMLGVHRATIMRLLVSAGKRALEIHDSFMSNLNCKIVQVDEIWTFVGKKKKQLTFDEKYYQKTEFGDNYTFVAIDAETKLVPAFRVGKRDGELTLSFMQELQSRINGRFQLSTDAFKPYYRAVLRTFGHEIDYAQIHKVYGENTEEDDRRYSPPRVIKIDIIPLIGNPKLEHISTSYVERQNLTMRMGMRRFTRLTNAFSKKLANLEAAVALHFFHYNFMRIHQTLRATPAMKAGLTSSIWTWEKFLETENSKKRVA